MNNKVLERELENNYENHEIFEFQSNDDLAELKEIIAKSDKDILIELKASEISELVSGYNNKPKALEYIISKIILEKIRSKYRNMEVPNEPINRLKAFNYIKLVNPKEVRLHIIINYNIPFLYDELLNYIDGIVPFKTMIYSNQEFKTNHKVKNNMYDGEYFMWEIYDYKKFKGDSEGELSSDLRKLSRKK